MKLKTNNKLFGLVLSLLIAGVVFICSNTQVFSQNVSDLQSQINAKQKQLNELNAKVSQYQDQINAAKKQANTLKNQVNILNLQIVQTEAQISATEAKIDAANLEIADVTNKIVDTQKHISQQKDVLKSLIAEINDLDQRTPLEIALENDNFAEFLDQVQYISSVQEQSQETLTKIKQLKVDLDIRQADLRVEKGNLDTLLEQLDLTNTSLGNDQKSKIALLNATKGQEASYQHLLAISESAQRALNDEINALDAKISEKLGDRKLKPLHGLLAWPMQGTLTQGYGNTGFTSLGYSFHNGIDVAGPAGTPIYAAGDGTVAATGTGQGAYGNWVAIKHSTGKFAAHPIITLYGHMSSFGVKNGQVLKMGDLVGFEGNTGNTTRLLYGPHRGYHLHLTVFDAEGFGVAPGSLTKTYGPYQVPYGAVYNPLDFL